MCYRTSLYFTPNELSEELSFPFEDLAEQEKFFHISGFAHPFTPFVANDRPELITTARWGLIPSWSSQEKADDFANNLLNARSETAWEKPSFRNLIGKRRGLLPVSGFIEWRHEGTRKLPHYIRLASNSIMTLGCLWDEWVNKSTGESVRTYSILTTEANDLCAYVHNNKKRMPVIVPSDLRSSWLSSTERVQIDAMMQPVASDLLEAYPISSEVSRIQIETERAEAIAPIGESIVLS